MGGSKGVQGTLAESVDDGGEGLTDRTHRRVRAFRRSGVVLVVLIALFYGGGGWYFSSQLGSDAFVIADDDSTAEFNLEVVAVSDDQITFQADEGSDPDLLADGVFGVALPQGWLQVGEVLEQKVEEGSDIVTRTFEMVEGLRPVPGVLADFDSYVYAADPSDVALEFEDVKFLSPVGELSAWFVPGSDDTWAIVIHGKGAERREGLRILESVHAAGYPALVITYRNDQGQPRDPSGYHRYGSTEWADVEGAVRYAIDHGAEDVVLVGLSTGAAHALSFTYQSELQDRVAAAIFDAPNIDFGRTVDYGASQRTLPVLGAKVPQSLTTVAKFIGSFRFDFDWSQSDYIDDASEIDFPILVFHGTEDSTVPVDVSERLRDERPDSVTLVAVEGAEHVQSWNTDPVQYALAVAAFLDSLD
jgi:pimeloyl-ACP methyl ester carboxylesterase